MQINPVKKLASIQVLRGIAALLVVLLHIGGMQVGIIAEAGRTEPLGGFWQKGFAGVDIFFVISGFIMVYITQNLGNKSYDVFRFLKSRVTRIFPLWWVYAGAMALIFFAIFGVPFRPEIAANSGGGLAYLSRSFLLIPQPENPILPLGWTLIHEMYFYFVFAVLLFLPRKMWGTLLLAWALQILLSAGLGAQVFATRSFADLISSPLTIEFILGAGIGFLYLRDIVVAPRLLAFLGAIWFSTALFLFPPMESLHANWGRVLMFGAPAAIIVFGLVSTERATGLQAPRFLVRLGDWSYSLYLGHLIVLLCVKNVWEIFGKILDQYAQLAPLRPLFELGAPGLIDNFCFAIFAIIACIIVAAISYTFVERPLLQLTRKI